MLKGVTDRIGMELCESIKGNMLAFGGANNGAFIMHDTTIDLSLAEKYQLS